MKGIVLAGGKGSRLWPLTQSVSKQLLPIFDKPMIYYPLATLFLAGIRQILIITTAQDRRNFENLLGFGERFGVEIQYATQDSPDGIGQAFLIGEKFIGREDVALILGDNFFYGVGLGNQLSKVELDSGGHIFTYRVSNPGQYGVLEVSETGNILSVVEKPQIPRSDLAITGLYFFDNSVISRAREIKPSPRGELEIISIIESYLHEERLKHTSLGRGTVWLDTGSPSNLLEAGSFVQTIQERTGTKIACLEEIALDNNWISRESLLKAISLYGNGEYQRYLHKLSTLEK